MSVTPASVNFLQNSKVKALARIAEISPSIESKKREVSGLRSLREAYEKDRSLGDASAVLEVSVCAESPLSTLLIYVAYEIELDGVYSNSHYSRGPANRAQSTN